MATTTRQGRGGFVGSGRRGKARTWAVVAVAGLAVGGVLLALGLGGGGGDGASTRVMSADVATAEMESFEVTTTAGGELEARNAVEIRSPLEQNATVQWIVAEGERVRRGDPLVRLNVDQLQLRIDEEKPRLAQARADLVAAENGYNIQVSDNASNLRQAELKLDIARIALEQWRQGEVTKKRQELALAVESATIELERLAEKYARSQKLLREGFISKDETDRDEGQYINAISNYTTALLALEVYERYEFVMEEKQKLSDVAEAEAELDRVRLNNERELANRAARRDTQREQTALFEARLAKLERQLASANMLAPQDGLVVYATSMDRNRRDGNTAPLQIGQQVSPNQLIILLPDTSEMLAAVRVHESLAGRVRPGLPVRVRIDAAGGKVFQGVVDSIGVMAETGGWRDPNLREYTVRVAITEGADPESMAALKPSMRAEATLVLAQVPETLTVPVQAVFQEGPVNYVYRPRGTRFERVPVRVGARSDTLAQVLGGLTEDEPVLLRQPEPGLVIGGEWSQEKLAAAGYRVGEDGQVIVERPTRPGGAGMPGPGGPGGAGGTRPVRGPGAAPAAGEGAGGGASGADGRGMPTTGVPTTGVPTTGVPTDRGGATGTTVAGTGPAAGATASASASASPSASGEGRAKAGAEGAPAAGEGATAAGGASPAATKPADR